MRENGSPYDVYGREGHPIETFQIHLHGYYCVFVRQYCRVQDAEVFLLWL